MCEREREYSRRLFASQKIVCFLAIRTDNNFLQIFILRRKKKWSPSPPPRERSDLFLFLTMVNCESLLNSALVSR